MKVAVMYSGGKDSTYAIEFCKQKGWKIEYLLSVKPTRTDCFLYHFATVELTPELAKIMGIKHFLIKCDVADPVKEAELAKEVIAKNPVDAVVLGGVGLQETQIKSLQNALRPYKIEVFAAHSGFDHEELFRDMLARGYKIMITQVATDGGSRWLGREITKDNFEEFKADSIKYGFHIGLEGGYMDSLALDAPFFSKRLEILESEKAMESEYCGHVKVKRFKIVDKAKVPARIVAVRN